MGELLILASFSMAVSTYWLLGSAILQVQCSHQTWSGDRHGYGNAGIVLQEGFRPVFFWGDGASGLCRRLQDLMNGPANTPFALSVAEELEDGQALRLLSIERN